jgi:hypothetical protein
MLANEKVETQCLFTIEGNAVTKLIPKFPHIQEMNFLTTTVDNDIEAIGVVRDCLTKLSKKVGLKKPRVVDAFNPFFYPGKNGEISANIEDEADIREAIAAGGHISFSTPTVFDEMGDFVCARREVSSGSSTLTGRVLVPTQRYSDSVVEYMSSPINKIQVH